MTSIRTQASIVRPTRSFRPAVALVLASAVLALPFGFAAGHVGVDASSVPFADLDADANLAGVGLVSDGGQLVVVFSSEGAGALGDAVVPVVDADGYPVNALGDVIVGEALVRSELIEATPGGFTFVQNSEDAVGTAASYALELADLGFEVAYEVGGHVVDFGQAGSTYRATFGIVEGGVRVYFGAI